MSAATSIIQPFVSVHSAPPQSDQPQPQQPPPPAAGPGSAPYPVSSRSRHYRPPAGVWRGLLSAGSHHAPRGPSPARLGALDQVIGAVPVLRERSIMRVRLMESALTVLRQPRNQIFDQFSSQFKKVHLSLGIFLEIKGSIVE